MPRTAPTPCTPRPAPRPANLPRLAGRIAFVLGTRSEVTRLAPVLHQLGDAAAVVHTAAHHDPLFGADLLAEWGLGGPDVALAAGGPGRSERLGRILTALSDAFAEHRPAAIVVLGGGTSAAAGALAAHGAGIPLIHVGAGARSHNRGEASEHRRVIADRLADVLCAATPENVTQLIDEDYEPHRIVLTGSATVEAVARRLPPPARTAELIDVLALPRDRYVLAALDSPANTWHPERLSAALTSLGDAQDGGCPVVLALQPRTRDAVVRHGLGPLLARLRVVDAPDERSFLALASRAALLVTDSGTVQETATVLGRPHLVVRTSTELPESLGEFAELTAPEELASAVRRHLARLPEALDRLAEVASPFGDGLAAERIAEVALAAASRGGEAVPPRRVLPGPDTVAGRGHDAVPDAVIDALISA
ncbi:UDP-N-acetylglucosamine 2-epimerase [Streptomyces sp. NBC_01304]|uniref:UDP-N-acetylglucosamine 2-epimerase n=1 Tax=Streptomyces sp. NBC_01304 TaxID=2903818 RepID=UPI002E10A180|nr:UDP-N-acetylglucosamine 2-epimerase [Streptomyces sp. NBC_01304]